MCLGCAVIWGRKTDCKKNWNGESINLDARLDGAGLFCASFLDSSEELGRSCSLSHFEGARVHIWRDLFGLGLADYVEEKLAQTRTYTTINILLSESHGAPWRRG
jgi:hypothetical protein